MMPEVSLPLSDHHGHLAVPQLARHQVDVASWHVNYGENRSTCTEYKASVFEEQFN